MYQTVDNRPDGQYTQYAQMRRSSPWDQQVSLRQIHPWDRYGLPRHVRTWDQFDQRRWNQVQEEYKQLHQAQQQVQNQERIRQQRREQHARKVKRNRMIHMGIGVGIKVFAVALVLFAIYSLVRWGFGYDILDRSGWKTGINGNKRYQDYNGKALTGWQTLDDEKLYYFSDKGVLQTGWFTVQGTLYYWDEGKTGWVDINGIPHFINDDLSVKLGWADRGDKTYYFQQNGLAVTGWMDIGQYRYYFGEDGVMHTGWLEWEGDTYYFKEDGRMAKGQVTIDDVNHFFTSKGKYVLVVNKNNPVPDDYEADLVDYNGMLVASECRDALEEMIEDGRDSGVRCAVDNIYRSEGDQNYLWWRRFNELQDEGYDYDEAEEITDTSLMRAGHSEHHTGLAVDFVDYDEDTLEWMGEHCWDYGYIVRYPDGKSDITEIIYEPWHFRYVGVELAQELRELDLCMEEYMQMLTEENNQ